MKNNLRDLCHNVTDNDDTFVGIRYEEEKVNICFPLGYQIPDSAKECKNSIFDLISVINLVKSEKNDIEYSEIRGESYEIPLNSYIWLIKDYLTNGLYYDLEKSYKSKINGKINWKRTLKTKSYISNGNIVYLNPIVEKSSKEENIITMIHILCLKSSIEKIGWLFGDIYLPNITISENNIDYYIAILKTKLMHSYVDHKKQLINHMILILEEKSDAKIKNKNFKYGTYHFNIAWEKMVTTVFGNIEANAFFPSAKYHLLNEDEFNTPELLPDTILKYNNNLYILDSKYYKYGITKSHKDLPSTGSIAKQITYGHYAHNNKTCRNKYQYQNVYNAFILPYNKEQNKFTISEVIEYRGYAINPQTNLKYPYEKIAIILIDTKYLMDCYFKREPKDLEKLISAITKV